FFKYYLMRLFNSTFMFRFLVILLLPIAFCLLPAACKAQNNATKPEKDKYPLFLGNLDAGLSVPIIGARYWNRDWEPNYMFAGSLFARLNNRLMLGLKVGFNHWIDDQ